MHVVLTSTAERDVASAAEWYEAKREGLGGEFLDRVEEAIDRIGMNPLAYRKVTGENRRCLVEQFPYALWFKIHGDAIVVACLHSARNPSVAKERTAGVIEIRPKP